jgi:hypothetical protein
VKRIVVPTRSGSDWQRLLAKPQLHWKRGASAMTAAAAWEAAGDTLPAEIAALLESSKDPLLQGQQLLVALPEWQVALEGGETTSNTDVLAICRNAKGLCVIAVEAKVLEDFGPLLKDKRKAASAGQLARLKYLHALLKVEHFEDSIRYQLLHRTASALLTAQEFHAKAAVMLVHAFDCPPARREDFNAFANAIGSTVLAPSIYRVNSFERPQLYAAWSDGDCRFREVELPSAL